MVASQTMKRTAYIVSDRTGLTAEAMAHSLLSQFPNIEFHLETFTFIDDEQKATELVNRCRMIGQCADDNAPMVFLTMVNEDLRALFFKAGIAVFDLFQTFIGPMEEFLGVKSSHTIGQSHGVQDEKAYTSRIAAVHFAMQTDDGMDVEHYRKADLIVIGVSRCGKTPASLYMSLHYGLYVSNYPLTGQELEFKRLPTVLEANKHKLFGLTIDPFRLLKIRQKRYQGSSYSDADTCQREIAQAESIYRTESIPYINSTTMSVEEIGAMIVNLTRSQAKN
ncbi:MAG: kinase/pyrophosphorylase [Granulosicoccus sp.]|nr:kinase/pyrophosphorylase [Granulosicoccus sp.]